MALIFSTRRAWRSSVQRAVRKVSTIARSAPRPRTSRPASARWRRCARARSGPRPRPRTAPPARRAPCWRPWRSRCRRRPPGCRGAPRRTATSARHRERDVGIVHGRRWRTRPGPEAVAEAGEERLDLLLQREAAVVGARSRPPPRPGAAGGVHDAHAAGGRELARPRGDDGAQAGGQLAAGRHRLHVLAR